VIRLRRNMVGASPAVRYATAKGSARNLIHHPVAHYLSIWPTGSQAHRHFQNSSFPNFDLSSRYRDCALREGAEPIDRYGLVSVIKVYRERREADARDSVVARDGTLIRRFTAVNLIVSWSLPTPPALLVS